MRVWRGIQSISTIRRYAPIISVQKPPLPHIKQDPSTVILGSRIFDPDDWSWKCAPEATDNSESTEASCGFSEAVAEEGSSGEEPEIPSNGKKKRDEVIEENRSDGHAPIKTACCKCYSDDII